MVRTSIVVLAVVASLGASIADEAVADAKNLSCISSEQSAIERRVIRDCGTLDTPEYVSLPPEVVPPSPPPPEPATFMGDRGGKSKDRPQRDRESKGGGGGKGGGSHGGGGGGSAAGGHESAGGSSAN